MVQSFSFSMIVYTHRVIIYYVHILCEHTSFCYENFCYKTVIRIDTPMSQVDKASVLGDAIKYMKLLQERVKVLEEQTRKKTVESAVIIKRSQVSGADDISPCNNNSDGQLDDTLPEIEGRVSDRDVLIRIHTDKRKGFVPAIVRVIENLHLSIVNSSIVPFGPSNLDITITAQVFCSLSLSVIVPQFNTPFYGKSSSIFHTQSPSTSL